MWALVPLLGVAGCTSVDLGAGLSEVRATVEERAAATLAWAHGPGLDREAAEAVQARLGRTLTADDAVHIALLSNRDLQARYSDLGVAQADLVQAGLFRNPVIDASVAFHLGPVRPDLSMGVVFGLLDALCVPLRKRVAAAQFEEAKLRVTGGVLDFVLEARGAFYEHQANEQLLELRRTVVDSLNASFEVSRRLHEAGNITDLDLVRDRAKHRPAPGQAAHQGATGPFGDYISMGGLFTVLKVRDDLERYDEDPGWYRHPPGTVALKATEADLARDGIDVNARSAGVSDGGTLPARPARPPGRAGAGGAHQR
jgi:hypothetical protein